MLAKQLIETGLQQFESYRNEGFYLFHLFYKSFFLSLAMCMNPQLKRQHLDNNEERIKLLQEFYFTTLQEAHNNTSIRKGESVDLHNIKVREKYFAKRKDCFVKLQKLVRDDYKLIYSVLKEQESRNEIRTRKLKLSNSRTVAITGGSY